MPSIDPEGAETRAINKLIDLTDLSIIEIGAGDGRLTRRLATRARSVVAIDPNESQILKGRASLPAELKGRVRFVATDATTYRFPRERFDAAVLAHSL